MNTFVASVLLAGAALVAAQTPACPTITTTQLAPWCGNTCTQKCLYLSTVENACGCPTAVPRATVLYGCDSPCPYAGCSASFNTKQLACPTTTSKPPPPPTTTSTKPVVTTNVIILTKKPTSTTPIPCPTVTRLTSPTDCPTLRCAVPTCTTTKTLSLPCDCVDGEPKTLLWATGCRTECPGGCVTRTSSVDLCTTTA